MNNRGSLGPPIEKIDFFGTEARVVLARIVVIRSKLKLVDPLLLADEIFFYFVFVNLLSDWRFQTLDPSRPTRVKLDSVSVVRPHTGLFNEVTRAALVFQALWTFNAAGCGAKIGTHEQF